MRRDLVKPIGPRIVYRAWHPLDMGQRPLRYAGPGRPPRPPGRHKSPYDRRWREAALEWLRDHPNCVCGRPASQVDHIRPHKGDMQLFWDRTNWQSLCHSCHSTKTNAGL